MVADRAKRMNTPLTLDITQRPNSMVFPSSTSPVSPSTARRIITENLPPPPPMINLSTTNSAPVAPPTDDTTSLGSSGVASTFSSVTDDSPVTHRVYTVTQTNTLPPAPVLLPPPMFADGDGSSNGSFSSLRSALRSSQDNLASL